MCIYEPATEERFDEQSYLRANPDVVKAIADGSAVTGLLHFQMYGQKEGRQQYNIDLPQAKRDKQERIRALFKEGLSYQKLDGMSDFLTEEVRRAWNIIDTDLVSGNGYDENVQSLIKRHINGLVLDVGSGLRTDYYRNVINYEIVPFASTDVLGVGEELPFKDNSIDAVISSAVLEHVKDPFRCAKEIIRVLKPGGELFCCVPFLQPYHGYPHHYYNMTHQGLRNLFEGPMVVDGIKVLDTTAPIWTLTWFLDIWVRGLSGAAKEQFLKMQVSDLLIPIDQHLDEPYVTQLPESTKLEIASACVLFAHKPREEEAI